MRVVICKKVIWIFLIIGTLMSRLSAQDKLIGADSTTTMGQMNLERIVPNRAFKEGEWLKFSIRYGPIKAGFAYMEIADMVKVNERTSYHVISRAESNDFFSTFYKIILNN